VLKTTAELETTCRIGFLTLGEFSMIAFTSAVEVLRMHRSGVAPVALFDDQDRFVGAIGVRNLLQAILRRGG